MLPPHTELAFNPSISHTDGLLADSMAGRDGVDYDMAQRAVEGFAADVLKAIEGGGTYMLPGLGSLSLIDERIVFEPAQGINLLTESYGLAPVAAQRIRSAALAGWGKLSKPEVRKVAISAAAVAAMLLVTPRTNDPAFVGADLSQAFEMSDAALADRNGSANAATANAEELPTALNEQMEVGQPMANSYDIVVASFITRSEASDYIASMKARGIDDLSILDLDGRCRVVAASFSNPDEARRANKELNALQGFENSWVLHVDD